MDSATHIVMGAGLAGLAAIDPVFVHDPVTHTAIWTGVIAGSVIPDIDTVLKLKDNATYIRHHRGMTHSLPATLLWPLLLTAILSIILPGANTPHLLLWSAIAVVLHVFTDIFNAYGTQALRPVKHRWVALDMINIFDPVIFSLHIAGFIIWYAAGHSGAVFLSIYIILAFYYIARAWYKKTVKTLIHKELDDAVDIFLSPTLRLSQYHVAVRGEEYFYVGEIKARELKIHEKLLKKVVPDTPIMNKAKEDKNIASFLSFSPIFNIHLNENHEFTEVRFVDLRYFSDGRFPFVAIAHINRDMEIISSFTGWVYSEDKLQKKLTIAAKNA